MAAAATATTIEAVGVPSGFAELTTDRELLVDVYFGGEKIGETRVVATPGFIKFKEPERILALVPNVQSSDELSAAFASELPTNANLLCSGGIHTGCGELSPRNVGIIFDEDHFRVDLFVNPRWLRLIRPQENLYLSTPTAPLSVTSLNGLTLSGSTGTSPTYNLQNQTIVGFRNARIRADSSYASKFGFVMDTAVGELDRPGTRYSAGLFWAPGLDLTGERRIAGVGVATQFDTRTDRDTLGGTPLVVFLSQPARVDILIDGRLVSSRSYDAGNNILDTSSLPDGSYSLVLQIQEANGATRTERRFFAKNLQVAPKGRPIYFGYVGLLANTRQERPISVSHDLFYQFGTARRLTDHLALDLSVIGTRQKPLFEAGGWLITPAARVRAAALASPEGDRGALVQLASAQTGRLSLNFDLRRIWSHDGKPLIPLPSYVDTFQPLPIDERPLGHGSYTQASGSIGYQFGPAFIQVIGSLRKDEGFRADYSIGPNINWPIVNAKGLQIGLQADAQITRTTKAGYVGFRMLFTRRHYAISSIVGSRGISNRGDSASSASRAVGDTTAHFSYADEAGTDLSVAGGLTREIDSTVAHAQGLAYTRLGTAIAEVSHDLEGDRQTQYSLTLQTGAVVNRDDLVVGGRNLAQSALVVSIDGAAGNAEFDVLINDQPRARLKAGQRLPIFLEPYRAYSVTLHPVNAPSVWYDSAAREFTLYPGNVQHVGWRVEHVLTVFGRAVRKDGAAVADAAITSRRGVGESNSQGYFQVEAAATDLLSFRTADGTPCNVKVAGLKEQLDYASLGKVICQ